LESQDEITSTGGVTQLSKFVVDLDEFNFLLPVNIPRAISMSYCGSEIGESEIYSPYSFCGSEAGADVAQGDPHDGWSTNTVMFQVLL
jgi:hypothetical protein